MMIFKQCFTTQEDKMNEIGDVTGREQVQYFKVILYPYYTYGWKHHATPKFSRVFFIYQFCEDFIKPLFQIGNF